MAATISHDLAWTITKGHSATLVKRANGVQFSRDPLNLRNIYSRKNEGQIANKAIGVVATENGGIQLLTKKADRHHQPISSTQTTTFGAKKGSRKLYSAIVNSTTKRNYRPDLRKDAVARASAIRKAGKPVKASPASKLRGAKALKAAEASA
ncbi:ribosomal L28e protein family-domain-containing protein [Boeremia exigua]|uniref:ribosomal L28e protein family-domain-containing protein n=1 Tax=Boeremia exigua TaxID=749465 RepID=UPI001E8D72D8|nr:ribosomal L28e protein family-domain-containing protein [Boeremia exigua]KAH6622071.1 ribosomal L28e protein family-domain-containing protein [Boeremia exigua]